MIVMKRFDRSDEVSNTTERITTLLVVFPVVLMKNE